MSEPVKKTRRKRADVVPTDVMAQAAQDSFAEQLAADGEKKARLDALFEESRRAERQELGAMLDERFAALRRDIDAKLDAIMVKLSGEVEKLSMRAAEVGDVSSDPLVENGVRPPSLAELWWEHVGNLWPTPQEELSLESVERSVLIAATTHRLHADDLFVRVLKLYAADPKAASRPEGRSAVDLQVRLHEYMARGLEMTLAELGEAPT